MNLDKFYLTSDSHLFHKNIIKYCNRPYEFTWEAVKQMNEDILSQFDKLPAGSTIINLGDIALNGSLTFDTLKACIDRMKKNDKKLWIVLGNHDREMHFRVKDFKGKYNSPYELFTALGFDRVFPYPILLEDKFLMSHEPVYLAPGSNLVNIYGHTHDIDITEDYFCHECENFAMMERVKAEGITEQTNLDIDTEAISDPTKTVDLKNYFNACWDKHHDILKLTDVFTKF